jgi:hypothetical protein
MLDRFLSKVVGLGMRQGGRRFIGILVATLLGSTGSPVAAGGLVDTSPERFRAADFSGSEFITNPWWTLTEGRNFLYFAEDGDDCVWSLTEVFGTTRSLGGDFAGDYAGTNARIVLDRGWVDEACRYGDDFQAFMATDPDAEEVTYDWYAEDGERNIWYMGEDTFDGESFAGSFVAGCDGAEAGIVLLGDPSKGDFYSQEYYQDEAEDWGKVTTFKTVDGRPCMKTKEWTPLEPGAVEHKWYCSDGAVGELTLTEELSGKTVTEELVATDVTAPPVGVLPISPTPSCP